MASWNRQAVEWTHPVLLLLCGTAAYLNSFSGVFVFDDMLQITDNPDIRHLWPPWAARDSWRYLLFYTFALNYAVSGIDPWS